MYRWIVYLHVFAAFAFMLVHGVYATVMWKLRAEADPERSLTLFNAVPSLRLQRFLLALVVITGLIAGLIRPWWSQGWAWGLIRSWWREGWMWTSLVLLIVITIVMRRYGAGYFTLVSRAAMRAIEERKSASALSADPDKFAAARATWHPIGLTVLGMAGLALILWLMMFKPF